MKWHLANKQQLLQIALNEACPNDFKFRACSELQTRWSEDMLTDIVLCYGRGLSPLEIAEYLGIKVELVGGIISKYGLRRARHEKRIM
jgi:DNA-directed RNA polymerase specialized sigma24 family protein